MHAFCLGSLTRLVGRPGGNASNLAEASITCSGAGPVLFSTSAALAARAQVQGAQLVVNPALSPADPWLQLVGGAVAPNATTSTQPSSIVLQDCVWQDLFTGAVDVPFSTLAPILHVSNISVVLRNVSYVGNVRVGYQDVIVVNDGGQLQVENSRFNSNVCPQCTMVFSDEAQLIAIRDTSFIDNMDATLLLAYSCTSTSAGVALEGLRLVDNNATGHTMNNLIDIRDSCNTTMTRSLFQRNYAREGVMVFSRASAQQAAGSPAPPPQPPSPARLEVRDSIWLDNAALAAGSLLVARVAEVLVDNCLFYNNTATRQGNTLGGAGIFSISVGRLQVLRSNFTRNTASSGAGILTARDASVAIPAPGPLLFLQHSRFEGNRASRFGAAVASFAASVEAYNTTMDGNSADSLGGAIAVSPAGVRLVNCSINYNSARLGGAVTSLGDPTAAAAAMRGEVVPTRIEIENCTLSNNTATSGSGGAVVTSDVAVYVRGSVFRGNWARRGFEPTQGGGAIDIDKAPTVSVVRSVFEDSACTGGCAGGALNIAYGELPLPSDAVRFGGLRTPAGTLAGAPLVSAEVLDSSFVRGAAGVGGAVALYGLPGVTQVLRSNFSGVRAVQDTRPDPWSLGFEATDTSASQAFFDLVLGQGGALAVRFCSGGLVIDRSNFTRCQASNQGGTMYLLNMTRNATVVSNSILEGSRSNPGSAYDGKQGAAIMAGFIYSAFRMVNTTIRDYIVVPNPSRRSSVVELAIASTSPDVRLSRCSFEGHFLPRGGSGVFFSGANVTVEDTNFTGIVISPDLSDSPSSVSDTAALAHNGYDVNGLDAGNIASSIMAQDRGISYRMTLRGSRFHNITGTGVSVVASNATVQDCVFDSVESYPGSAGHALEVSTSAIVIRNSTFTRCRSNGSGAAVYASNTRSVYITNSRFHHNSAGNATSLERGAALWSATTQCFTVCNSEFINNTATAGGSAILGNEVGTSSFVVGGRCALCPSITGAGLSVLDTYAFNVSYQPDALSDEVIQVSSISANFQSIANCTFRGNTHSMLRRAGGAVMLGSPAMLLVDGNVFEGNSGMNGGGFSLQRAVTYPVYFTSNNFMDNRAVVGGGALQYADSTAGLVLSNNSFIRNSAQFGGGLYATSYAEITVHGSRMEDNTASSSGGAIFCSRISAISINATTLRNNSALTGGAVQVVGANELMVASSIALSNTAHQSGGAIHASLDSEQTPMLVLLVNTSLIGNSAGSPSAPAASSASSISGSGFGGGLYASSTWVLSINSTLRDNTASDVGGGIFFTNGTCPDPASARRAAWADGLYTSWAPELASHGELLIPSVLRALNANTSSDGCARVALIDTAADGNRAGPGRHGGVLWAANPGSLLLGCSGQVPLSQSPDRYITGSRGAQETEEAIASWLNSGRLTSGVKPVFECPEWRRSTTPNASVTLGSSCFLPSRLEVTLLQLTSEDRSDNVTGITAAAVAGAAATTRRVLLQEAPTTGNDNSSNVSSVRARSEQAPLLFGIRVLDSAEQLVTSDAVGGQLEVQASIQGPGAPTLRGQVAAVSKAGVAGFQALYVRARAGLYNLTLSARQSLFATEVQSAVVSVEVEPCALGEVEQQDGYECVACVPTTFTFDNVTEGNATCRPCPNGGICTGGAVLVPDQGYWASSPTSDNMISCPHPQACRSDGEEGDVAQGLMVLCQQMWYEALAAGVDTSTLPCQLYGSSPHGTTTWTGQGLALSNVSSANLTIYYQDLMCSRGYTSNLCGQCQDINGTRMGMVEPFECRECAAVWQVALVAVSIAAATLFFIAATTSTNMSRTGSSAASNSPYPYNNMHARMESDGPEEPYPHLNIGTPYPRDSMGHGSVAASTVASLGMHADAVAGFQGTASAPGSKATSYRSAFETAAGSTANGDRNGAAGALAHGGVSGANATGQEISFRTCAEDGANSAHNAAAAAADAAVSSHQVVVVAVHSPSSRKSGGSRRSRGGDRDTAEVHSNPMFGVADRADPLAHAAMDGSGRHDGQLSATDVHTPTSHAEKARESLRSAHTSPSLAHVSGRASSRFPGQPEEPASSGLTEDNQANEDGKGDAAGDVTNMYYEFPPQAEEDWKDRARQQGRLWMLCEPSDVLKVLTIHLQVIGIIMSINVEWPNSLARLGSFTNVLTGLGSKVYTLSCLANQRDPRSLALVELLGKMAIQLLVVALDQVVWLVLGALAAARDRRLGRVPLTHKWGGRSWLPMSTVSFVSFVSAVFVVFPTLNDLILSLFTCVEVDDGRSGEYPDNQRAVGRFWVWAMSESCSSEWYNRAVIPWAISGVVLVTFGFPALLLGLLWKEHVQIKRARAQALTQQGDQQVQGGAALEEGQGEDGQGGDADDLQCSVVGSSRRTLPGRGSKRRGATGFGKQGPSSPGGMHTSHTFHASGMHNAGAEAPGGGSKRVQQPQHPGDYVHASVELVPSLHGSRGAQIDGGSGAPSVPGGFGMPEVPGGLVPPGYGYDTPYGPYSPYGPYAPPAYGAYPHLYHGQQGHTNLNLYNNQGGVGGGSGGGARQGALHFVRDGYGPHAWFWEPVLLCQVTALVAIAKFGVQLAGYHQACVMALVLAIWYVIERLVRPLASTQVHHMRCASMFVLIMSAVTGIFYYTIDGTPLSGGNTPLGYFLQALCIIANAIILLACAVWVGCLWWARLSSSPVRQRLNQRLGALQGAMRSNYMKGMSGVKGVKAPTVLVSLARRLASPGRAAAAAGGTGAGTVGQAGNVGQASNVGGAGSRGTTAQQAHASA